MLGYLATLLVLLLTLFIRRRWRFRLLPSPGLCLPLIGHVYKGRSENVEHFYLTVFDIIYFCVLFVKPSTSTEKYFQIKI